MINGCLEKKSLSVVIKSFESSDLRSIRNLGKTTEITKWLRVRKKSEKKLICRDREDTLDNQNPQKSI